MTQRKLKRISSQRGAVLFVAILFSLVSTAIMLLVMNMAYQRARLVDMVGVQHSSNYYRAQGGLVDAFWRLRTNTAPLGGPGTFATAANTYRYWINLDDNTVSAALVTGAADVRDNSDVRVDIGARDANATLPAPAPPNTPNPAFGLRLVTSTGLGA